MFAIPTTFGIANAPCYIRAERATQSAARVGSSLFDFFIVPSTHYVPKIVFTFSAICRACKNSIAIYLINMRDLSFFSASSRTSNPQLSLLVGCDSNGKQRNQPCDCSMTWAFHVHQKICHIKISAPKPVRWTMCFLLTTSSLAWTLMIVCTSICITVCLDPWYRT